MNARMLVLLLLASCATTSQPVTVTPLRQAPAPQPPARPTSPVSFRPLQSVEPMLVVLQPKATTPIVSLRLVFKSGAVDDPPGKEGLTALTTRLLLEGGTRSLEASQVLETLFPMAAELEGITDKELVTISGRVHQEQLARFEALLAEMLLAPRFEPREFERLKAEQLTQLTATLRQENDEELSKVGLESLLYRGHPYGHFSNATEAGLRSVTLDDVKAQWQRVFTQDRLIIGLAGAVDAAHAEALKKTLGAMPATSAARPPLPTAPGPNGKVLIIQRQTASTAGDFGFTSELRRGDPGFIDLFIALSYFGEHRQEHGVLFQEVRDKRGLNYGTYAYAQHYGQVGWQATPRPNLLRSHQHVSIWLRPVAPGKAMFATRAVFHFLDELRDQPIPPERFEAARGFLSGATRIWALTDQLRLGWAIDDVLSGTPDFLEQVRQRLTTITPAEAQAAVRATVRPERFNLVFVTKDAKGLADALFSQVASPISYDSPKDQSVLEADARIATHRLPIDPTAIEIVEADAFMRR